MARYKTIAVSHELYDEIANEAKNNNRTMGGQIAYMVKLTKNVWPILSVTNLSDPDKVEPEVVAVKP